ncbi:group I truncated hemoglobin [Simplicispira suum]|uniref:Group 1 truncated hemoglobin n=1 Tax=Simplicispira suum TaxID=2109915 RepID=A0A2S0N1B8_9BURK|nr:group 1 truncated hemoglobin [Simplicispira suum]AVO41837.1 group 1 truncated hemoglobin [Simplicispira suum]MBW7832544.1 group 1 truncated hemoglobin [Simplicispira suum]
MKIFSLCFALALAGTQLAHAQTAAAPDAPPPGLYAALGEKAGIDRLADDFVERLLRHPRIGPQFKEVKPAALKESLAEQFCVLSGGPCTYQGADMLDVHADMDINKGDFNALVEVLQRAMDAQGIAFSQQNRLLALLAPMHRDIITVR